MRKTILVFLILLFSTLSLPHKTHAFAEESSAKILSPLKTKTLVQRGLDNRVKILQAYLEGQNSPLADNAEAFVKAADDNKIDWKLVAAISGVESTFGQEVPNGCNNAWGYGIYGDNMRCFKNYNEAIATISTSLRNDYMNKWNANDIWSIGRIYAASPAWASRVNYFVGKIDDFSITYNSNITDPLSISI